MAIDLPTVSGRLLTAFSATRPGAVVAQSWRFSSAAPSVRSPVPAKRLVTMPTARSASSRDERPEVARLHADVRVGDDVHLAGRLALEADELRDLGVDGRVGIGDDDARVEPGVAGDEARARPRNAGSSADGDAEEQLERGVVDARERLEVGLEVVVAARERLEDGDARRAVDGGARWRSPRAEHAAREEEHHRRVEREGRGRQRDREVHEAHGDELPAEA